MFVYILYIILAFSNREVSTLVLHSALRVTVCFGHSVPRETGVVRGEALRDDLVPVLRYLTARENFSMTHLCGECYFTGYSSLF